MTRTVRFVLPLVCLAFAGCSGGMRGVAGSSGSASAEQGRLEVFNNSSLTVTSIETSSCSAANWGANRLSGTLAPGARQTIVLPAGCWDFRADFDAVEGSGNEVTTRNAQVPEDGRFEWTLGV